MQSFSVKRAKFIAVCINQFSNVSIISINSSSQLLLINDELDKYVLKCVN